MTVIISSRHMEVSAPLKMHAEQKAGKLLRYYDRIQEIEVVFDAGKDSMQVEVIVNAERHNMFIGRSSGADAYACFDDCVDKLERQLTDHKKKLRNRKHPDTDVKRDMNNLGEAVSESNGIVIPATNLNANMKLKDFIVTDAIVADLKAADRDAAIRELVAALAAAGGLDPDAVEEVTAALIKREQNGSTGFGRGVAVPHVKHAKIKKMSGTIGRSAAGIDFAALDHQPVFSVVLLLSPENQPQQHLQAMNIVFSNLQKDMFRRFLRQSATREAISDLLDEADQGKG